MSGREFSFDPVTGIRKVWHYDHRTDKAVIESVQDAQGIMDHNTLERNAGVNQKDHGLGRKVGSVPLTIYYQWKAEARQRGLTGQEEGAFILGKLRSREFCRFMTVDKV